MKKYPPDPADVMEGFRQWLSSSRGAAYAVVEQPDTVHRNRADIDYVLADPDKPPKIALEVSSVWRSEEAGKEDAYFAKWFERVRARIKGRIEGTFHIFFAPISVPKGVEPETFGDALLVEMDRQAAALRAAAKESKGLQFSVQGVRIHLHQALPDGSDIDYGRFKPDMSAFPDRVKTLLAEKAPKLKRYKDAGLETWIVAYNTAWTIRSPVHVEQIVKSLLGPEHAHVDHVGISACDPPDDGWIFLIR